MGLRGFGMDQNPPKMFLLLSQAPSPRREQSFIKISSRTDENDQELCIKKKKKVKFINPSGAAMRQFPRQAQLHLRDVLTSKQNPKKQLHTGELKQEMAIAQLNLQLTTGTEGLF